MDQESMLNILPYLILLGFFVYALLNSTGDKNPYTIILVGLIIYSVNMYVIFEDYNQYFESYIESNEVVVDDDNSSFAKEHESKDTIDIDGVIYERKDDKKTEKGVEVEDAEHQQVY